MTSIHSGMNVSRRVIGGSTTNQVDPRSGYTNGSPPTLQKAVVVDVIYDYNILTEEYKEKLSVQVGNYELIDVIPIGSVIAQIISNDSGTSANPYTILFPFFSSHFMLPVQVGEVVHVIYQDYVGRGNKLGFWLSRIHGTRQVEDANYTHLDRQFDPLNNLANWTTENIKSIETSPDPNFPNGGDTTDTYSISPTEANVNPYDQFLEQSVAARLQTPESVPRWNKRPQELVLQGANNTLICFGEDRSGPAISDDSDEESADSKGFSGTIDIVVGRGRFPPASKDEDPELTAARVIKNSRDSTETDKAPYRNKNENGRIKDNPLEGNPDFVNDAARLYVSMQSVADTKFGVTTITFPAATLPISQPTNEDNTGTINRSYVVGKADHIRFIARKNEEKGIDGTILLLREGDPSDSTEGEQDLSFLFVDKNGINLESKKIFFGSSVHEDPNESSNINYNDDDGPYEPWILWSKYKATVDNLQKQITDLQTEHKNSIQTLRNNIKTIFTNIETAFNTNVCPPYGANPGITAAQVAITDAKAKLDTPVDEPLDKVKDSLDTDQSSNLTDNVSKVNHSQKIYGH